MPRKRTTVRKSGGHYGYYPRKRGTFKGLRKAKGMTHSGVKFLHFGAPAGKSRRGKR